MSSFNGAKKRNVILPSMIKLYAKQKHEKKIKKQKKIRARDAGDEKMIPKTIESDEEFFADIDFNSVLKREITPKILITTTYSFVSTREAAFISELLSVIPNSHYYKRGTYYLEKIVKYAKKKDFTSLIVVHTNRREPDALRIISLPNGPTARFKLSEFVLRKDVKVQVKVHGNEELRNWAELPPELTSAILSRLDAIDILENAQNVCRSWRSICQDPFVWRKIDVKMDNYSVFKDMCKYKNFDLETMCRDAIDRSQGGLVEINFWYFSTNRLLNYIADRSSNLRSLRFIRWCHLMTDEGFSEALVKLPLLEYFEVSDYYLSRKFLRVLGQSCPNLRTLKLNSLTGPNDDDGDALVIAESMPELRHLELVENNLTSVGLNAILDGCPNLEHLDLRMCFNVDLTGDLEKRCIETIKYLKRPNDSVADYSYYLRFFIEGV